MSILDLTTSLDGAVADLCNRVGGAVLTERDPNYAEACAAWNLVFQHRSAVLVVAESAWRCRTWPERCTTGPQSWKLGSASAAPKQRRCATRRCVWPSRSVWWSAAWLPRSAADRSHVGCVS